MPQNVRLFLIAYSARPMGGTRSKKALVVRNVALATNKLQEAHAMMRIAPRIVQDKLKSSLTEVEKIKELFIRNPGVNFTRERKLPFGSVINMMLKFSGQTLQNEISEFFVPPGNVPESVPTKSAFIQQRGKILPDAVKYLMWTFSDALPFLKTFNGYRLFACDGSDVPIPRNTDEEAYSVTTREDRKSYNMLHINGLFDIMNRIFVDCIVDPGMHARERLALETMVSRIKEPGKAIIIADRGYEGFNCIAHLIENKVKFAIRAKDIDSNGFLQALHLPSSDEFDVDIQRTLTFNIPKDHKNDPSYVKVYRGFFDFLENGSTYDIAFRVVRFKLPNGTYECIVTNLSHDSFSPKELRDLYHRRWQIENAYRDLKYTVDMLHFHGKSADAVLLELFSSLTMFNFCAYIAVHCDPLNHSSATKYRYKVNFANTVGPCRAYLHGSISEAELLDRLRLSPTPIRPNRQVKRSRIKEQSSREFNYRAS